MSAPALTVDDLARHLASLGSVDEVNKFLRQGRMLAASSTSDEELPDDVPVTVLRDYLAQAIPIPPSLVWPTIAVRGEITTTLGRAGKGKTTMNLNRIFAWSCGRALFPGWIDEDGNEYLAPEKPLRTLIAENEGNAGMFHRKVGMLLHNGPLNEGEREMALDNLYIHGDGGYSGMKLDNDEGVAKLRKAIDRCRPDIVFIEPFRSLWRGEENSATDMAVVVDNIVALATEFQCAVILSHHEKKGGAGDDDKMSAARGSTVLEGVVAVMENFESVKDGEYREMTWSKARYEVPPPPVRMNWDRETGWYAWVPSSALEDEVIKCLREADDEPLNLTAISEELGETKAKLRPVINKLKEEKKIKQTGSAQMPGGGTTGPRFRLPTGDGDNAGRGGLAL